MIETPRFSEYKDADFVTLTRRAIAEAEQQIDMIASSSEPPTFANTIEALELSGESLDRLLGIFYPLLSADADDKMMEASITIGEMMSDHSTRTAQNHPLFDRVRSIYEREWESETDPERRMLLENTYLSFQRSGALLEGRERERFAAIDKELSELTTRFSQNVKKELATYSIPMTAAQADGLPLWLREQTAARAREEGMGGDHLLTLQQSEYMAFMSDCADDSLRRKVWTLYNSRNRHGEYDNTELIKRIVALRLEKARLLGHDTFAHYRLQRSMARTPEAVIDMLQSMREAYRQSLRDELDRLRDFAGEEINPWNYSYHFKRLRKLLHNYDPEEFRPYLPLEQCIKGVFSLAHTLYGINIEPMAEAETYHPDVRTYVVTDGDGTLLGLLYADFFSRPGRKSPGAWMTEFREADAQRRPWVNIVMNFNAPADNAPATLTPDDLRTLLHEFGHALHSLLTRARYSSLAGTNVYRDFVELPSQFNENFLTHPAFMATFTDIPPQMVERLRRAEQFGAAYRAMRQLTFGFLDMAWHTIEEPVVDIELFEMEATGAVSPFRAVAGTGISPTFGHIFSGGYASGYYSYKWAEMLDADAFEIFKAEGVMSPEAGARFRREILEKGGTDAPDKLYRAFAGRDPDPMALLRRDGICK